MPVGSLVVSEPDLRQYLDLVALGTIADLVPLQGVNRTLARYGLALLDTDERAGIKALKQVAGVKKVSSGVVGFQLAPRLNAAGRMEDAGLGVELLLEQDMVRALNTARYLDQCNRERQNLEKQTLQEAEVAVAGLSDEHTHAIVISGEGWHPGVIGIVASRLVERYWPTNSDDRFGWRQRQGVGAVNPRLPSLPGPAVLCGSPCGIRRPRNGCRNEPAQRPATTMALSSSYIVLLGSPPRRNRSSRPR